MEGLLVFSTSLLFCALVSGSSFSEVIFPNFTASNLLFVDNEGAFLFSRNGTFKAAILNPGGQATKFYLCVMHVASNTIIWSANRDAPVSSSGKMNLTINGITISDQGGHVKWFTPPLKSSVYSLLLTEMGNLLLRDQFNRSLWESFQYPTDTIVTGQELPVATVLSSAVSNDNLSTGDYRLAIADTDLVLQWHGQTYWMTSMDTRAVKNSNDKVNYMSMNSTGLFLFGQRGLQVVIQIILPPSNFRIAQLSASGQFIISGFSGSNRRQDFVGPLDSCQIPFICGRLGLCTDTISKSPTCSCPPGFQSDSRNWNGCLPIGNLYLPMACTSTEKSGKSNSSGITYLGLGYDMDYFTTIFSEPIKYGVNLSVCQDICTASCSCLGIFFQNSSGSCFALEDKLGSIILNKGDDNEQMGYIKAEVVATPNISSSSSNQEQDFPVVALVLLPFTGFMLMIAVGFLWWRRWRFADKKEKKLCHTSSHSSEDLDAFYIPGLPQRFDYEELEVATDNFKNHIGSGGFGAVYKGTLPDKTVVAVKKIINLGIQGNKDFCSEIAAIGNIRHVNLVKLRGYCAQGKKRLLVYEYMSRGSLDKTLFGGGAVLEWQERFEIALGTARGLAYLHTGCEQKIIHCDVKPENILLHDHFQAKISDFGLSKLLGPEQSSLFTTMRGTRGYLAPEWLTNAAICEKTDVYSFGMVLLELVSGRKNCLTRSQSPSNDESNSGGTQLTSSSVSGLVYFPLFALEMHEEGRYLELADPKLEGRVRSEEVEKLVYIALCCVHEEPGLRPSMVNVVGMLEGSIPVSHPRIESLNFLRFYGRGFTEASMIEEGTEQSEIISFPLAKASATSGTIGSYSNLSFISSQHISGPR
ncbi:hypothetical protein K2173_023007 [Erythroxylum novogranatense]|uniref:Receptor-like serine/threonine-protein kinase n=1 Tax=Erythroxylum novogranatense TaxID=1862640 RepID=A0AAV8T9M8_9ROSI|nr:hypothetical protein K2173_023007 [Erythroxylum novogranatense]